MKRSLLLFLLNFLLCHVVAQQYWQQKISYHINVSLNDSEHTLNGFITINYTNQSPDTLSYIWFHLWPNAYKNDKTLFSDQMLENGKTNFYFSSKEDRGYINRLDFRVNNTRVKVEDHSQHIDIVKVNLPLYLYPGQSITITTPFHVKLPYNFSRGGHEGQSYQITQWYPKPAVYDRKGWHPISYVDQGEFYSEFADYEVEITVPKNYVVAATGELQNEEEKKWLSKLAAEAIKGKTEKSSPSHHKLSITFPPSDKELKTLTYKQNNIHDFAWFADKRFIVNKDTMQLASGKKIEVYSYYTPAQARSWSNSINFIKEAVKFYSAQIGEYPYNVVSAVQGPESFGGGMEYPTITIISPTSNENELESTIVHEVGHNWFYGILASNEREHPFMDEGMNSFYTAEFDKQRIPDMLLNKKGILSKIPQNPEHLLMQSLEKAKKDQPIDFNAERYNEVNYDIIVYYKTTVWMNNLRNYLGKEVFDRCIKNYYEEWKFKHPYPEDLKASFERTSGKDLTLIFDQTKRTGSIEAPVKRTIKPTFLFNLRDTHKYNYISILPALGYNTNDGFMPGGIVHNYNLPLPHFRFLLAPLYGTQSKKLTGLARMSYTIYPNKTFQSTDVFIAASSFSTFRTYTDTFGTKEPLGFFKIVPGVRFTFKEKDPRSEIRKYIQFKTYFFNEDKVNYRLDSAHVPGVNQPDTTILYSIPFKAKESRYLNQLLCVIENARVLYPYRAELNIEQGKDFIRAGFTGNYFFNYAGNRGGVNMRFFAGKFFYLGQRTSTKAFNTDRYQLSLSAPKGDRDYTYSSYFIGRNDYPFTIDGTKWTLPYQQIMIRDGGLKMNTDVTGNIGVSDNWISSLNFSIDIPKKLNPLAVLPIKIPLKIFADIGTYAEAWKKDFNTDRFLYDAGLQFSLLRNNLNIYVPLLYSKVYKDYLDLYVPDKQFLRKISFSIDIQNFNIKKIDRRLPWL